MRDFYQRTDGSVAAPAGFSAAGVACGIKANGRPDLAIIASDRPASAAAVFTTNRAVAAPVIVSREHLGTSGGKMQAIVVNSGCANACTGADGLQHAREMAAATAAALGIESARVLVASTGVIGVKLKMPNVARGIDEAARALSPDGGPSAARAIMTTDPFPKEAAVDVHADGGSFRIGGCGKGRGVV